MNKINWEGNLNFHMTIAVVLNPKNNNFPYPIGTDIKYKKLKKKQFY